MHVTRKRWPGVYAVTIGMIAGAAFAQPARMRDLAGEFTGETKTGGGHLDPAANSVFRRSAIKGRIHFHRRKVARIEFEPLRVRQIHRIESATPVFKTPSAGTDAYFLLIGQIQMKSED